MDLSYWEFNSWFSKTDFTVVGSGITGLNCALRLRERFPKATILVVDKGILPYGASTRNAGFACFGSLSEILADLETHTEEEVFQLVQKRWAGIKMLRSILGDKVLDYQQLGGHELFLEEDAELYNQCLSQIDRVNKLLSGVFGGAPFEKQPNRFRFKHIREQYISHRFEGQIDTGAMMQGLLELCRKNGIQLINGLEVRSFEEINEGVRVTTDQFVFKTGKLLIATNGFASEWLSEEVVPARAQVLITKPIDKLAVQGTFHLQQGYYYFRNIHNRLLIGGGRNLDFKGETTTEFGQTQRIQEKLEELLRTVVIPGTPFEVAQRWSGIMGVGSSKQPIVRQVSGHVYCGVRLGGMGIAIGSLVGKELADLVG